MGHPTVYGGTCYPPVNMGLYGDILHLPVNMEQLIRTELSHSEIVQNFFLIQRGAMEEDLIIPPVT